jgi:RNA polymerase sigma-70 factor (ECF subfamily)
VDWVTTSTILHDLRDYANDDAWRRLVERFRDPIVRFVEKLGFPEAEAEDVTQDALLAFAEKLRAGLYDRERGRLRSWLFGIVYKQALKQRERDHRRERPLRDAAAAERAMAELADEKTVADLWDTFWERFLARECFRQVRQEFGPDSVRAFELVVREDRSPQQAADEIGVPVKAVYNAKHRILKRMRELRAEIEEMA